MYYNIKPDQNFALILASIKNISIVVNEAIKNEFIHLAIDFLEEEAKALKDGIAILKKIEDKKYNETFKDMLPTKAEDVKYAINLCNTLLIKGQFKIAQNEEEYNLKKKRSELKVHNLKELKNISMSLEDWEFADYLTKLIQEEDSKKYQA